MYIVTFFTPVIVFFRRLSLRIRRSSIRALGLKLSENYFLDSPYMARNEKVKRLEVYAKPENIEMPSLFNSDDKITFSFQRRFIYEIPNAIIDPMTGMVYDESGKFIAESSSWDYQRLLSGIPKPRIRPPRTKLKGEYLFLPTTPTYYHWLIEDLPPFLGALKYKNNTKIIVGPHQFPPINDFISRYLKGKTKKCSLPVRVEKLIMTGKIAGLGSPIPPHNTAHPKDLYVLKEWFKDDRLNNQSNSNDVMIYLSRSRWKRAIEGEILLEKKLESLGFIIFHGDISIFEQIKLFSQAKIVVGASGAALSNLVWCQKNTKVIQIHPKNIYYRFYFNISCMLNLDYNFIEAPAQNWSNLNVDSLLSEIKKISNL